MSVSWLLLKKSDRQSRGRVLLTILAVTVGMVLVLSYGAALNGLTERTARSMWTLSGLAFDGAMTQPIDGVSPLYVGTLSYNEDYSYVRILSVRAGDETSPKLPGLSRTPHAGEYYASSAMVRLVAEHPDIGVAFGTMIGTIPDAIVTSPDSTQIIRGIGDEEFATLQQQDGLVRAVYTMPNEVNMSRSESTFTAVLLVIGSITLLFPIILLISVATQLGSKQREQRYATLRLVGATKRQVNRSATLESLVVGVLGVAAGTAIFLLIRPLYAPLQFDGMRFYLEDLIVPGNLYVIIVGVTLGMILLANWWGLRRVKSSPLGVVRQQRLQKQPHWWRLVPLAAAITLLVYMNTLDMGWFTQSPDNQDTFLLMVLGDLILMICGLIVAGPWLTSRVSWLIARRTKRPVVLLATKRISLLSRQTFRAVSGVVIALYIGSFYLAFAGGVQRRVDAGEAVTPFITELAVLAQVVIGITLFVAILSLVVSTIGGMLERRRSFHTLRLTGVTVRQLRQVMAIESLIPLVIVSLVASALGVWTSAVFVRLASASISVSLPSLYYLLVIGALVAATIAIVLLSRRLNVLTTTEQNQTE